MHVRHGAAEVVSQRRHPVLGRRGRRRGRRVDRDDDHRRAGRLHHHHRPGPAAHLVLHSFALPAHAPRMSRLLLLLLLLLCCSALVPLIACLLA
jgi:hypothetical protein